MRRLISFISLLVLLGSWGAVTLTGRASADVNDFTITNFTADERLTNNDPQGELRVIERITVNFSGNNHGILRALPTSYKHHALQLKVNAVSSESGAPSQYTTYGSNGNTVIKIGSSSQTVTGAQEYTLDYTLHNVITFYPDHDELYFNVNGGEWTESFDHVGVVVHLPKELQSSQTPLCYTGVFGSTNQACTIDFVGHDLQSSSTEQLTAHQTLTYVAGFQKGYFTPYAWYDSVLENGVTIAKISGLPLVTLVLASSLWFRRGRDARGRGVIVPQYEPPEGLGPLDVGTIIDFKVDNKDISAMIISLAIRGYLKIIETKQDRLIGHDKLSYVLELTNVDYQPLNTREIALMQSLFPGHQVGQLADISALKSSLFTAAKNIREDTEQYLTKAGYFRSNPLQAGKLLVGMGVVGFGAVYIGGQLLGGAFVVSLIIATIIAVVTAKIMPARTVLGVAAKEHIAGLKMYLQVAEADRLKMLQAPGAPAAANAGEPVKTVELFEKLLPYAMVLGVEKDWAGQFTNLYAQPPGWYGGSFNAFSTLYLLDNLNDGLATAVNQAFSAPRSSGNSGFGGGGFSGGGGGGGGGGGW